MRDTNLSRLEKSNHSLQPLRQLSLALIVFTLLACNLPLAVQPAGTDGGEDGWVAVGEIPNYRNLSPTLNSLEDVEQEMRQVVREPLREVLGADADALFAQADAAYKAMYAIVAEQMGAQSARPPGLAQFEAFRLTFGMLMGFQEGAAKSSQENIEINDKLELTKNARIEMKLNFKKSGSKLTGEVDIKISAENGGSTFSETAKGKYEVELCPDAQGKTKVTFDMRMDTNGAGGGNTAGIQFSMQGSGDGTVNDEAALTGLDMEVTSGLSSQSAKAASNGQIQGEFAEVQSSGNYTNVQDLNNIQAANVTAKTTRASSKAKQATVDAAYNVGSKMSFMLAYFALYQAEKLWQNGYCLEILIEGAEDSNTLPPSEKDSFTAKVRHKFEGVELDAPISGALTGEKSLTPLEKTKAPVNYTYEAPSEKDKTATVKLETRSKRGVATKEISFKTMLPGYVVSGRIDEFNFSGTICDPNKPFTINGAGGGASAVFTFTPETGGLKGNYTYKGGGGGITLYGSGPYRIIPGENGYGTLELGGTGCVNMGECAEGTDPLDLRPIQDDNACK